MTYDFTTKTPIIDRIVFALSLNRKNMTERIVIGIDSDVRRLLKKGIGDVYLDVTNPLGTMLLTHENDNQGEWHNHITQLCDSYNKGMVLSVNRWKFTAQANAFLQDKYKSGIPMAQYAAIRMWNDYLYCYDHPMASDSFRSRTSILCRIFYLFGNYKPWDYSSTEALQQSVRSNESSLELYYPDPKRGTEYVVAYDTYIPLIFYYLKRIEEWKLYFLKCKVCQRYFLARSRRYELCSPKCRSVRAKDNKKQFDDRTKDKDYEQHYNNAYNYFYNHLRRLKKRTPIDKELLETVTEMFKSFRTEAL